MPSVARKQNAPNFTKKFNVAEMTRPKGMPFDQMWDEFMASREAGLYGAYKVNRPKSIKSYRQDLIPFFAHLASKGHKFWNEVTPTAIENFVIGIQGAELTQNSKAHVLRSLKALSNWIDVAPKCSAQQMQGFRKTIPRITKGEGKVWVPRPETMQKFWRALNTGMMWDFRDHVIVAVMLDCGARSGEIRHMVLDNLKLEENSLLIPEEGKTGTRLVPIHPEVVALLREWLAIRVKFAKRDYVFCNDDGGRMGETCLPQSFKRNRERTGIDDITPHTVRHFFATHYLVNGGSPPALQTILGHTSAATMNIYVHLAGQMTHVRAEHRKASPMARLNNAEFGPTKAKRKRDNMGDTR